MTLDIVRKLVGKLIRFLDGPLGYERAAMAQALSAKDNKQSNGKIEIPGISTTDDFRPCLEGFIHISAS